MELRLEIKLASVEELATVAKALTGLQVSEVAPKETKRAATTTKVTEVVTESSEEEMIEVESPYTAHPSEVKAEPIEPKVKALSAAEKKAAKKAQDEAERADRIERLKASMEANKEIANQALAKNVETPPATPNGQNEESAEAIVEEIKQLGDRFMAYQGVAIGAKLQLTAQVMAKVGVPAGVRPTQLQQPMLGHFRDLYKAAVDAATNPVMGGLV